MILSNAPVHEAVMSNMKTTSEFTIKNSAKAFGILSSNLYSNKIKAIIRELSCNAVDSHILANKEDTKFIVHLPNVIEPWFSVQDFGVGLNHNEVQNIYTTYFESTKNGSNDFIGGLGLGSKSPFAYTDNFTVTAIKNGIKNIYSAYINNEGVPSIVLMESTETEDMAGVTVSLAVQSKEDYQKFINETKEVFKYFKNRPKITGCVSFTFMDVEYKQKDIVPGISTYTDYSTYQSLLSSIAVMGNIGYKIDVPNTDKNLGTLSFLLNQGLEINFNIGELDLQPSREGLSYNESTIQAIKRKLECLSDNLMLSIQKEMAILPNTWDKVQALHDKYQAPIWKSPIHAYVKSNPGLPIKLHSTYLEFSNNDLVLKDIEKDFNISLQQITIYRGKQEKRNPSGRHSGYITNPVSGLNTPVYNDCYPLSFTSSTTFVINDIKAGIYERLKFNSEQFKYSFYILSPKDKTKEMDLDNFFAFIKNPPESYKIKASTLTPKPKAVKVSKEYQPVSIVHLKLWDNRVSFSKAGSSNDYPSNKVFYYLPIKGFGLTQESKITNIVSFITALQHCGSPDISSSEIYGVRKGDLENIKLKSNWINLEEFIPGWLSVISKKDISAFAFAISGTSSVLKKDLDVPGSAYEKITKRFQYLSYKGSFSLSSLEYLVKMFNKGNYLKEAIQKKVELFNQAEKDVHSTYPLLKYLTSGEGYRDLPEVKKYITMQDHFTSSTKI